MNRKDRRIWLVTICMVIMSATTLFSQSDPDIDVTPLSFNKQIPFGSSVTESFTITNAGAGTLQWHIETGFDSTSTKTYTTSGALTTHEFHTGVIDGDATVTVTINGDFDDSNEYAEVIIEGTNMGQIEDNNVSNGTDIVATFHLASANISNWTSDGMLSITIDNSNAVDTGMGNQTHQVRLEIQGLPNWLSVSRSSGMLSSDQSQDVDITFDTNPLEAGTYSKGVIISSNDPDEPEVTVSVTLTVIGPSISVDPTSLSMNLNEGNQQSSFLTISNTGEGLLQYEIQLSSQAPGLSKAMRSTGTNMSVEAAIQSMIQRSGIGEHEIRTHSVETTSTEHEELVIKHPEEVAHVKYSTTSRNAGFAVAVLGADYEYALLDVQEKLLGTDKFRSVTTINVNATTPTLTELLPFDAIIIWRNRDYSNYSTLGNNLADYVDNGGGVVCAVFEVAGSSRKLGGRWESGVYHIIERGDRVTSRSTLGTIHELNHPIMDGVHSFDGGYSSYRPSTTSLTPGATLVASWSDGKTLVAVKRIGNVNRVDLGFYPVSSDIDSDWWQVSTQGALLMANALVYAAGGAVPWCAADPNDGDVPSASSEQVTVTFDASTVDQGFHQGYLVIENNDPNNATLSVPLSLNVTDVTPPGAVYDLQRESAAATFAILSWTAPGDNGSQGIAESYDLRYSTQTITEANWQSATPVTDTLPNPASPGTAQQVKITNLTPHTLYSVALKTQDEADLSSSLSNVLEFQTRWEIEGLVYLPFEESSGDVALNYQGDERFNGQLYNFDNLNGRDVAANSGWTQFGYRGGALKFDGSNDYVSIEDFSGSPLQINVGLTICVAVKLRNDIIPTGRYDFLDIIDKINNTSGYALRMNEENGRLRFMIQFGQSNVGIYESNQSRWAGGEWYELMITYDYYASQDNVKIYIDGALDASYTESRIITTNDDPILIGGTYYDFAGSIDEVIIHNAPRQYFPVENYTATVVPDRFSLAQNYPNPFNPTTSIQYAVTGVDLSSPHVTLKIYNLLGQEVRILVDDVQEPGYYTVTWDGRDELKHKVASGVYFCRLKVNNGLWSKTRKMVFMK